MLAPDAAPGARPAQSFPRPSSPSSPPPFAPAFPCPHSAPESYTAPSSTSASTQTPDFPSDKSPAHPSAYATGLLGSAITRNVDPRASEFLRLFDLHSPYNLVPTGDLSARPQLETEELVRWRDLSENIRNRNKRNYNYGIKAFFVCHQFPAERRILTR